MRNTLIPLALVMSLAAAGIASAAETVGTVKWVDINTNSVTLQDGSTFLLPRSHDGNFPLTGYRPGDQVKILWTGGGGGKTIESIAPVG